MRAAVLQMTAGIDPGANARTLVDAVAAARADGADMLFTPEMSGFLDRDRARAAAHVTVEAEDRTLAAVRDAAARAGLWVQLGSLAVRHEEDPDRWANRGYLIDDTGAIRARYTKMHLFDVDLSSGVSWRESASYVPGAGAVVADTPWGRIGLSICYDLRFPDLFRAMSDAGAVMLAVPAAFTAETGEAHWAVLLRARAIEAGAFVIAAAQTGLHADGRRTYGHSLAVDPWGTVLMDLGAQAGLGIRTLDMGLLADVRARVPVLRHRRPIDMAEIAR